MKLHRIEGLSEQFVYFNDDIFLLNEVNETDFFKKIYLQNLQHYRSQLHVIKLMAQ